MQPSIRKRLAALSDLFPGEGFSRPGLRIGRFNAEIVQGKVSKLADDSGTSGRVGSLQFRCAQNRRHFVFLTGSQTNGRG
jgi:hypothetical protein